MSYYTAMLQKTASVSNKKYGIENEGDYYEEVDGYKLLHCKDCKQAKQTIVFISTMPIEEMQEKIERYAIEHKDLTMNECEKAVMEQRPPKHKRIDLGVVGVPCKCEQEFNLKNKQNSERVRRITENKQKCFPAFEFRNELFSKYEKNKHIRACEKYAKQFGEMLSDGMGMVLCGQTGAGKSVASICLANSLLDREYKVGWRMQYEIVYSKMEQRDELLKELLGFTLLIIDDFNLEGISEYGRELLFYVIDSRIKAKKPTVLTSNISKKGLENCHNDKDKRICERLADKKHFYIIEDSSNNYRK